MSFVATVERAPLLAALKRLSRIADPAAVAPILSGVMIRAEGDCIHLEATDLQSVARVTIPATVDANGAGVAKDAPLAAIAAKLKAGALVELRGQGLDRVAMVAGRFRAALAGFPAHDWPALKPAAPAFSFSMTAGPALAMLESVAKDCRPPAYRCRTGVDDLGALLTLPATA